MEKAVLVNVQFSGKKYRDPWPPEESANELAELARSSGLTTIERIHVNREKPNSAYLIGKGKVEEIHQRCDELGANVAVFSDDLSFPQQRNLEEIIGIKVIDRTQLILDIFAQRANSEEGKVQVELAQLQYLLPRLAGEGIMLSRLGGGIGTRGPGEQKLEIDRRRIRARITRLSKELQEIHRRRGVARRKREEEEMPVIALIGYTNAGKTTLLNALTQAGAVAEDRLFTTLDPLARRLMLPNHQPVLLTDTVGFLHRLPHHLVEAFRATLDEVTYSDLLLHVVDASNPLMDEHETAVHEVLEALGAQDRPRLLVCNKIDRIDPQLLESLRRRHSEAAFISAATGAGLQDLLARIGSSLSYMLVPATVMIGAQHQKWLERIYEQGQVLKRTVVNGATKAEVRVPHRLFGQLSKAGLIRE